MPDWPGPVGRPGVSVPSSALPLQTVADSSLQTEGGVCACVCVCVCVCVYNLCVRVCAEIVTATLVD